MAQHRTRADETVGPVVHRDHQKINAPDGFVEHASGITTADIAGHVGMHIGHQGIERARAVSAVEFLVIGPVNRAIEKIRIPAAVD